MGMSAARPRMNASLADREAVRDLVQRTAVLLDQEKFDDWVGLFDAQATYELRAYSTELRRWMTWQLSDRDTLARMLQEVSEHVRDPAQRRHVVGYPLVELDGEQGRVHVAVLAVQDKPGRAVLPLHGGQLRRPGGQTIRRLAVRVAHRSSWIRECWTCSRTSRFDEDRMPHLAIAAALTLLALFDARVAAAQGYPNKPVHVFVTSTAGGPLDVFTRLVTNKMEQRLKQPFIIENKAGAGGNLAVLAALQGPADGYNIVFSIDTTFTVNPSLFKQMPFDAGEGLRSGLGAGEVRPGARPCRRIRRSAR